MGWSWWRQKSGPPWKNAISNKKKTLQTYQNHPGTVHDCPCDFVASIRSFRCQTRREWNFGKCGMMSRGRWLLVNCCSFHDYFFLMGWWSVRLMRLQRNDQLDHPPAACSRIQRRNISCHSSFALHTCSSSQTVDTRRQLLSWQSQLTSRVESVQCQSRPLRDGIFPRFWRIV